jgi:hypothetical protein
MPQNSSDFGRIPGFLCRKIFGKCSRKVSNEKPKGLAAAEAALKGLQSLAGHDRFSTNSLRYRSAESTEKPPSEQSWPTLR